MVVTNEKKAAKLEANRARRNAKYEAAMNEGWRRVRKQEETYIIPPALIEQLFAVLTIRSETTTRFQIWTKFITESLLQGILHTLAPKTWQLEEGRFFRPTMKMIYMTMAIYVRVQGIYKVPHV